MRDTREALNTTSAIVATTRMGAPAARRPGRPCRRSTRSRLHAVTSSASRRAACGEGKAAITAALEGATATTWVTVRRQVAAVHYGEANGLDWNRVTVQPSAMGETAIGCCVPRCGSGLVVVWQAMASAMVGEGAATG